MLAVSALFLLITGLLVALRFGRSGAERFWIVLASAVFQIGGIAVVLSLFNQLAAVPWMVVHGVIALVALWLLRKSIPTSSWISTNLRFQSQPWTGVEIALAFLIAAVTVLTFVLQWITPIFEGDEKMYHASRVLYWMTNRNIVPYPTHNDRQTVLQFGSELFFLWPVLLTRLEWVARSVFWLGVPLAIVAQWLLLSALRVSRVVSLGTVLMVMSTPLVTNYAPMLKPEMWSIVFFCGLLWWSIKIVASQQNSATDYFWLAVYFVLCLNIRSVEMVLLVPLVLLLWSRGRKSVGPFVAGLLMALVLSGAVVPLAFNWKNSGNPLGPEPMRKFHASVLSVELVETHTGRFFLNLIELPAVPGSVGLAAWNGWFRKVGEVLGANRILAGEKRTGWPGYFEYNQLELAHRFSLGGLLWLMAMGFSFRALLRKSSPQLLTIAIFMGTLTGAIVLGIRWMQHSGLPERFLITPYVAGVILAAAYLDNLITRRPWVQAVALLLLPWAVIPPVCQALVLMGNRMTHPITLALINDPFQEALPLIPSHSRILLFGNHQAPDYPLFGPYDGYSNSVFPWGKEKFDAATLRRKIDENHITHLLFQDQRALPFEWAPLLEVPEILQWLRLQSDIPMLLSSGRIRLFATAFAGPLQHQVTEEQQLSEVPAKAPLLVVGKRLQPRVGVDTGHLGIPWDIEDLGPVERGYLWLGSGLEGGISFNLIAKEKETVSLELDVEPGPSRAGSIRTLIVEGTVTHQEICRVVLEKRQTLYCTVGITPGPNELRIFTPDTRTIAAMPNGDTRPLLVGLHQVTIEPAGKSAGK